MDPFRFEFAGMLKVTAPQSRRIALLALALLICGSAAFAQGPYGNYRQRYGLDQTDPPVTQQMQAPGQMPQQMPPQLPQRSMQPAYGTLDQAVGGVNRSNYGGRSMPAQNSAGSALGLIQAGGQQPSQNSGFIQRASYQQPPAPGYQTQDFGPPPGYYGQQPVYGQPPGYGQQPIYAQQPGYAPPVGGSEPDPWIAPAAGMYQPPVGYVPESAPACDDATRFVLERDCGSLRGISPYAWLQGVGGNEYGVRGSWYTNLGLFVPLWVPPSEDTMLSVQANGAIGDESTYGANAGLVLRHRLSLYDSVVGAGLWYDIQSGDRLDLQQLGFSLEWLNTQSEFRFNGYYPISTTSRTIETTPTFSGNRLILGQDTLALKGVDAEAGLGIFAYPQIWLFGGLYYYTDSDNRLNVDPVQGLRGRLEYRASENLTLNAVLTNDNQFSTQAYASATLSFRRMHDLWLGLFGGGANGGCRPDNRFERLTERKTRIMSVQQHAFARGSDGEILEVAQVNGGSAPGGDGSPERPFNTLAPAVSAVGRNGIIFERGGTFTEPVSLLSGQRLLADGFADTNPHQVQTQVGVIELPGQQSRAMVALPQITSNDPLATIKLVPNGGFVDNVEVRGFGIQNTVGSGIAGILNSGVSIRDNVVGPAPGWGLALLNPTGTTFANPSSPITLSSVDGNTFTGNSQGGVLLANVNLASFNLAPTGVTAGSLGVPLTDRGPVMLDVGLNTITDNARNSTVSALGDALGDATLRNDRFGIFVTSLTDSRMTINLTENTLERNGVPGGVARVSSSGGLGVLAGGSSRITVNSTDSTFRRNAGNDIHAMVGDGPATTATARLDLNVARHELLTPTIADTDDGLIATGLRAYADIGTLNVNVIDSVITGAPGILASGVFDRMDAISSVAEGTGTVTTTLASVGTNPLGRAGNEITGWHTGLVASARELGVSTLDVRNTTVDVQRVLLMQSGEVGDPSASRLNVTLQDSVLISRLPTTSPLIALLANADGGSQSGLSILDSQYRFEGTVDGTTPNRNFIRVVTAETARMTFSLIDSSPQNSMLGFKNFVQFNAEDQSTIAATISNSTLGVTKNSAIYAEALNSSRITLNADRSTFSGAGPSLIDTYAGDQGVISTTLVSNNFTTTGQFGIRTITESTMVGDNARQGITATSNVFNVVSDAFCNEIDSTAGLSTLRVNLIGNTGNGQFCINQTQVAPGSALASFFLSNGNAAPVNTGTVTSSASLLDIVFP